MSKTFVFCYRDQLAPAQLAGVWPPSQYFLLPITSFINCVGPSWHCISRRCCVSCRQTALCVGLCGVPVCPCSFGDRRAQFQCSLETSSASGARSGTASYSIPHCAWSKLLPPLASNVNNPPRYPVLPVWRESASRNSSCYAAQWSK